MKQENKIEDWNKIKKILSKIRTEYLELELALRKAEKVGVFRKSKLK